MNPHSDTLTCTVNGCHKPALVTVHPTHGRTDHITLRCRDCLMYDMSRSWFKRWKGKLMARDR